MSGFLPKLIDDQKCLQEVSMRYMLNPILEILNNSIVLKFAIRTMIVSGTNKQETIIVELGFVHERPILENLSTYP